jgi:hypothetical protein
MFVLWGKPICRSCAELRAQEAKTAGHNLEFARIVDATICGICRTDYGSSDVPLIGGVPVCGNCAPALYARPFPSWLKLSMAGLLLLLAGALWRGLPYFRAGRHLVLAERAMDRQDYRAAASQFGEVLKVGPTAQKVLLNGAKANLLAGAPAEAGKFLSRREQYEKDDLFNEVNGMWTRALDAYKKTEEAGKLAAAHKEDEAAGLMHEASNEYPESQALALAALNLDIGTAFDRKDYDGFLRLTRAVMDKIPDDPAAVAGVASALACKYAVTGDPELRQQAEQMLDKAQALAQQSPQSKAGFDEYSERIRYRLQTRDIIDKEEYDRRFRQKATR